MQAEAATQRRPFAGLRVVGACGLGAAALLGAGWAFRIDLAEALIAQRFREAGVEGEVALTRLDAAGATLAGVRVGPEGSPALAAARVDLGLRWGLTGPKVASARVEGGVLRARIGPGGISFGELDRLLPEGAQRRPKLPAITLEAPDAALIVDSPFGGLAGTVAVSGRLDEDFRLAARFPVQNVSGAAGAVVAAAGQLTVEGRDGALAASLSARADRVDAPTYGLGAIAIAGEAKAAQGLSDLSAGLRASADRASLAGGQARAVSLAATGAAKGFNDEGALVDARIGLEGRAEAYEAENARFSGAGFQASLAQTRGAESGRRLEGPWRVVAADAVLGPARFRGTTLSGGAILIDGAEGARIDVTGAFSAPHAQATPEGRRVIAAAIPELAGTPLEGLADALRGAVDAAAKSFSVNAPIVATWRDGVGAAWISGPATLQSPSGLALRLEAADGGAIGRVSLPEGGVTLSARATLSGGGAPVLRATVEAGPQSASRSFVAKGRLEVDPWRDARSAATIAPLAYDLSLSPAGGALTLDGAVRMSGPLGGFRVDALEAPVDLSVSFGAGGVAVAPAAPGCLPLSLQGLSGLGYSFGRAETRLCPIDGAFYRVDPKGLLSGGLAAASLRLSGRASDRATPASVSLEGFEARAQGDASRPRFAIAAGKPTLIERLSPERALSVTADRIDGEVAFGGEGGWRAQGRIRGGAVDDPALPTTLGAVEGAWSALPRGDEVILGFSDASALVTDKTAPARFQPLAVRAAEGQLEGGVVTAAGRVALAGGADRTIGRFTARHVVESGQGEAKVETRDLTLSPQLELYELTELARGVVENVRGAVDADFAVRWDATQTKAEGAVALKGVSAATSGLGPIEGVAGTVRFDDVFALTTPPAQTLTIAEINPGVAVRDGVVRFQLKPNAVVALEDARFPFSGGTLAVAPVDITIGAPESRYLLRLENVDIATFLKDLDLKDLDATGKVSGDLPVVITPLSGRIEGGRLEAAPGGGVIRYAGDAAQSAAEGGGQLAFDALKGFRYDNLILAVDGDLDGEIVTQVRFEGVNIEPIRPLPMLPTVSRKGLPFRFNVSVRAPFRALVEQAARTANPMDLLKDAGLSPPPADSAPVQPQSGTKPGTD